MAQTIDHADEEFRRRFRPREYGDVCVLVFGEDFDAGDPDTLALLGAGIQSMVRGGVFGFVFDLGRFTNHADIEEGLGQLVKSMQHVVGNGGRLLNWLYGGRFVREWQRLNLPGTPPHDFLVEQDAVDDLRTVLKAARLCTDLARRIVESGLSIRDIANAAGVFEGDVRRVVEDRWSVPVAVVLLISSTLDSLRVQPTITNHRSTTIH